jgi:hypothetical protein
LRLPGPGTGEGKGLGAGHLEEKIRKGLGRCVAVASLVCSKGSAMFWWRSRRARWLQEEQGDEEKLGPATCGAVFSGEGVSRS